MPETNIYISAKDNFSDAIKKMQQTVTPFRKDMEGLSRELDALSKNKTELKLKVDDAKAQLKEARKEFEALADTAEDSEERIAAASKLSEAQDALEQVQRNYQLVSKQVRQTEKDMTDLGSTMDKTGNKMRNSSDDMLTTLAKAGLGNMLGQSLTGLAQFAASSALGDVASSYLGSTLSGVASGAAMGSMAGPVGTAIGAVVGGISGALGAYTQELTAKDDAYKDYLQEAVQGVWSKRAEMLSSGSQIAGGRETDLISFTTLLGSKEGAESFLADTREMAKHTPFFYDDLTSMSKNLMTFGYSVEEVLPALQAVGDTGAALGLGTSDMLYAETAIGRMRSTDKVSLEYLNMLTERGIGATQWIADAYNMSIGKVYEGVSDGDFSGEEVAQLILDKMSELYGGAMEKQSQTFEGLTSTLEGMQQEVQNAYGEGYNETRKLGLQAEIESLDGDLGQKMQEAYSAIGAWEAELENKKEEYIRNAMTAAMDTDEYKTAEAEGNAAEMGRIIAAAQINGQAEYDANEGKDIALQSQLALIETVQSDATLLDAYETAGYTMGNAFTKGMAASIQANATQSFETGAYVASQYAAEAQRTGVQQTAGVDYYGRITAADLHSHAFGLERVPYDGYPAMLHENERVLTANQARQQDTGGTGNVTIAGGNYYIREEADIDKVAEALAKKILLAKATARP